MNDNLWHNLVSELDVARCGQANWYHVGRRFGISTDYLDHFKLEYLKEGGSPTECLLGVLQTWGEDEPTMKDFAKVLGDLGRNDILVRGCWISCETKNYND